jgi:hypothetical protein
MMRRYAALLACGCAIWSLPIGAAGAVTLTAPERTGSGLRFTVVGESNANYFIESSTNLQHWSPIFTNRNAGAPTTTVSVPVVGTSGYYRAREARPFMHGIAASGFIDLKGRNVVIDSFNSTNLLESTNGRYDPMVATDRGMMAAYLGLTNSLSVGNAKIYGYLWTGTGRSVMIGPQGCVGDKVFVMNPANNGRIQAGHFRDDMEPTFAPVVLPDLAGPYSMSSGDLGGTNYVYLLEGYNYRAPSLTMTSGTMLVTGHATLYVVGGIDIGGTARIVVGPSGSLRLYAGGPTVSFAGNGIVNQTGRALEFQYYGLNSNTALTLTGNGDFRGTVYAPNAEVTLRGGGSGSEDFSGAIVGRTVTMDGQFRFHYDESLAHSGPVF